MCVHFAGAEEKCTFSKQNKPTINRHSTDKEVNHKVTHLHRNQLTKVMKQQLINNSPKVSKATFYQNLILYSKYYIKK